MINKLIMNTNESIDNAENELDETTTDTSSRHEPDKQRRFVEQTTPPGWRHFNAAVWVLSFHKPLHRF